MIKQVATDHDLLVTVDVKLDSLTKKVDNMGDGMSKELADHQQRITVIEETIAKFDPRELTPRFLTLEQTVHDFKTTAIVWRTMAGAVGGALFYILTQIPNWLKLFI